jgi:hypothetical protein
VNSIHDDRGRLANHVLPTLWLSRPRRSRDEPLKIMQRCGHAAVSTMELCIREAEALREGFGEAFPALPDDLLGIGGGTLDTNMAMAKIRGPIWPTSSHSERGGRDSNPRPPA